MCALRYSAPHRNLYNLIYRLDPVRAYDMKLVKRIEVDSVLEDADFNQPYISVNSINATRTRITAKLAIDVRDKSGPKRKNVTVSKNGVDLFDLSGEREMYQGYIVDHIDAGNKYVAFTNGERLYEGQAIGENRDERMRVQVRETVKEHLEKELRIHNMLPEERRLKVLSLFFIDKVANYADDAGKIRRWFVEAYEALSKQRSYAPLNPLPLRLPVDASGERSFDANINKLTVIANESYAEFAAALQNEIEEETGVKFEDRIVNKRRRRKARLKEDWRLDENFEELWSRIKHKTRYCVDYDTQELILRASKAVAEMPEIRPLKIVTEKRDLEITKSGVGTQLLSFREEAAAYGAIRIPDLLGHIQRETELTRGTIVEILTRSGRLSDVKVNPQQFMDGATRAIRKALDGLMVDGIKYEPVMGPYGEYEMLLFEKKEIDGYEDRMLEVKKSIYDAIEYDSGPEERFAKDLDSLDDIKLFVKLPSWFKVETPIGTYNPDWAIGLSSLCLLL